MMENYNGMWQGRGLDLESHDALLEVLGKGFRDIYMPDEIVRAADATLVGLCAGADFATDEVEKLLRRKGR